MAAFKKGEIPHFKPEDCPGKMAEWLQKNQIDRDNVIFDKMHSIHMDILDLKNNSSTHGIAIRLLAIGFAILLALILLAFNMI